MKDFNHLLTEQLDNLQLGGEVSSKGDLIMSLSRELESARERVSELEMELRHTTEEYNIELAKALRKRIPQVGVNLDNGRCSASYKSTCLSCHPDVSAKTWVFEPNPHGRRFTRRHGTVLNLGDDVGPLADAIINYFSRYKSIR